MVIQKITKFLQIEWDARLLMERSLAIKSPSIQYHLAGTKKVQQALATPGSVERFIDNVDMVEEIKSVFAGIYSLDHDDEGNISQCGKPRNSLSPKKYFVKSTL